MGYAGFHPDLHDPHTLTLNKLVTLPQVRGQGVRPSACTLEQQQGRKKLGL